MKIKEVLREKKIPQWKVAREIGVSEFTFCRWLREPLSEERHKRIIEAVEQIEQEVKS